MSKDFVEVFVKDEETGLGTGFICEETFKREQEKAILMHRYDHALEQWKNAEQKCKNLYVENRKLQDQMELLAISLRSLILAVEDGFKNPDGFPVSDIEHDLYLARGAYFYVKQKSVEGEK